MEAYQLRYLLQRQGVIMQNDQLIHLALKKIVNIAGCYRAEEPGISFDEAHVYKWVEQFEESVRLPLLNELAFVLERTYINRQVMKDFLRKLFNAIKSEESKCNEWKNVNLLRIQQRGNSQSEMLSLFNEVLAEECHGAVTVDDCSAPEAESYIYLDDFIFTGLRLKTDVENWLINEAPENITLYVVTYGSYAGFWYNKQSIEGVIDQIGKKINLQFIEVVKLENRKAYSSSSHVLWPSTAPNTASVANFKSGLSTLPHKRQPIILNGNNIFQSESGRQLLEQQFLIKGIEIIELSGNFSSAHKPLGFMGLDSFGFGAMHITYRNCPNNAPLALWAGGPWYPLFPRKTN